MMKILIMMIKMMMMVMMIVKSIFYFDISGAALNPVLNVNLGALGSGDYDADGLLDFGGGGSSVSAARNFFLYRQNTTLRFYDVSNGATFPAGPPPGFFKG